MISMFRRFSKASLLALGFVAFLVLGYLCFTTYLSKIPNFANGEQSDYIIDAYYYIYLATDVVHRLTESDVGIVQAATDLQPNQSSFGIVVLSTISLMISRSIVVLPLLMTFMLFGAVALLVVCGDANKLLLMLPFSGLFPYYFLPSKELFCVSATLVIVWAMNRGGRWLFLAITALGIVFLSRPEAAILLIVSGFICVATQSRIAIGAIAIVALVIYMDIGREAALAASTIFQLQLNSSEAAFCNVGSLQVCVDSLASLEPIYVQRLITLFALPVKWVTDVAGIFGPINVTEAVPRIFVALHVFYIAAAWHWREHPVGRARKQRRLLFIFAVIYSLTYGLILYFQPTRQLVLATTFACIAFSLRDTSVGVRSRQRQSSHHTTPELIQEA